MPPYDSYSHRKKKNYFMVIWICFKRIHTYIHIHTQIHIYTHISTYIYTHKYTHIYIHIMYIYFGGIVFLGPHLHHMEVPKLGVESELQLLAHATDTAVWDPSCVCDPNHSSQQHWILNPLSRARDQTCVLTDTSRVCHHWATTETSYSCVFNENSTSILQGL